VSALRGTKFYALIDHKLENIIQYMLIILQISCESVEEVRKNMTKTWPLIDHQEKVKAEE